MQLLQTVDCFQVSWISNGALWGWLQVLYMYVTQGFVGLGVDLHHAIAIRPESHHCFVAANKNLYNEMLLLQQLCTSTKSISEVGHSFIPCPAGESKWPQHPLFLLERQMQGLASDCSNKRCCVSLRFLILSGVDGQVKELTPF